MVRSYLDVVGSSSDTVFCTDLTQYPIFPFVLRDYTSEELDLSNPNTFRDLSKPMGAQDPTRLKKFIDKYEMVCFNDPIPLRSEINLFPSWLR